MSTSQKTTSPIPNQKTSKHGSRIAAVQVMYQMDMTGGIPEKVLSNFLNYYVETEDILKNMSEQFLKRLVSYFEIEIDFENIISPHLVKNGSMITISSLTKSLIKVAIIEMMFEKTDIPVIINEYVDVAKYFLEKKSVSFINAILDRISKTIERKNVCLASR